MSEMITIIPSSPNLSEFAIKVLRLLYNEDGFEPLFRDQCVIDDGYSAHGWLRSNLNFRKSNASPMVDYASKATPYFEFDSLFQWEMNEFLNCHHY